MLGRHVVIVDSWMRRGLAILSYELVCAETYYAYGSAWTAFLADDDVGADLTTLQMKLTNNAAGLLAQGFCGTPLPASIDVQRILAEEIARALHGTVGHTTPAADAHHHRTRHSAVLAGGRGAYRSPPPSRRCRAVALPHTA